MLRETLEKFFKDNRVFYLTASSSPETRRVIVDLLKEGVVSRSPCAPGETFNGEPAEVRICAASPAIGGQVPAAILDALTALKRSVAALSQDEFHAVLYTYRTISAENANQLDDLYSLIGISHGAPDTAISEVPVSKRKTLL